jgi:hypothetical protein
MVRMAAGRMTEEMAAGRMTEVKIDDGRKDRG